MKRERGELFWKVCAVLTLLVLVKLAFFAGSAAGPNTPSFELLSPLQAQGVAIGHNAICTAAADGRTIYCWSVIPGSPPTIQWIGSYRAR